MQGDEDSQCDKVDRVAADLRDFRHGGENHGAKTVACNEKTQAEGRGDTTNAKDAHDGFGAGRVDGRANVDGGCKKTDLGGDEDFFPGLILSVLNDPTCA